MRKIPLPILACAALITGSVRAGDPPTVGIRATLSWDPGGDETCPSGADLERRIEQRIGRPVFAPRDARVDVRVSGSVSKRMDGTGFTTKLELFDRTGAALGQRTIETDAETCADVAEAVVLVTAVMLDYATQIAKRPPAPPSSAAPPSAPPPSAPPPSASPATERLAVEIDAAVEGSFGEGTSAAFGPRASVVLGSRFAAYAGYRVSPGMSPHPVHTSLAELGLGVCVGGRTEDSAVRVSACGAFEAGLLRAATTDYPVVEPQTGPWLAPAVVGQLTVRLVGRLHGSTGVSAALPLLRDRFVLERSGTYTVLFQPDRIATRAHLGLAWVLD